MTGSKPTVSRYIRDTRDKAREQGRRPEDLLFFLYAKIITGDTEAAVRRKYDEYLAQINYEGELALLSGWAGIDFGQFDLDQPLEYVETNAVRSLMLALSAGASGHKRTLRDLVKGLGSVIVGTPERLADVFQEWIALGVDGFNIGYVTMPGSFTDFVEGVVPVLQRRGLMQTEYGEGTLREKLFGTGCAGLPASHPDAQYRR